MLCLDTLENLTHDWIAYSEQLNFYLHANDVEEDAKKRSIFLVSPSQPAQISYKDIVRLLTKHFRPVAVERLKFHSCIRQSSESLSLFIAYLRQHCEFGQSLYDERPSHMRHQWLSYPKRLSETNLTFQKAIDVSLAFELVEKDMLDIIPTSATPSPQSFTIQESGKPQHWRKYTASTSKGTASCYRCGGNHPQNQCRFREAECHFCHKKGDISKVCNSRKRLPQPEKQKRETTFLVTSADTVSTTELISRSDHCLAWEIALLIVLY